MAYKMLSPEGKRILYSIRPDGTRLNQHSTHLIIHINMLLYNGQGDYALLGCLYTIKLLYNHPLPMATGAIRV